MILKSLFTRWHRPILSLSVLGLCLLAIPADSALHNVNVQGTTVGNFRFVPATLNIQPGDTVRWRWISGMHTTTSTFPGDSWNVPINSGSQFFQRTFNNAGKTIPYLCVFHFQFGMTGTIIVAGAPVNDPPVVANPGTQSGDEDVFFSVTVTATDPDGDALNMTDGGGTTPGWATFTNNGNNSATIDGTPAVGDAGIYNQTVIATDGGGLSDSESFDIDIAAVSTGVGDDSRIPAKKFLLAPHPNPFQSSVVLSFELEKTEEVRIDIFDLSGRQVRQFLVGVFGAGRTELTWLGIDDLGRSLGNGIYFVRMEIQEGTAVRKVFKTR